jgi:Flp pilus assembly pilin Flp
MRRFCRLAAFCNDEGGGQVIEWPMLTAMITLLIVAAWAAFGTGFSDLMSAIGDTGTWAANQVQNAPLP